MGSQDPSSRQWSLISTPDYRMISELGPVPGERRCIPKLSRFQPGWAEGLEDVHPLAGSHFHPLRNSGRPDFRQQQGNCRILRQPPPSSFRSAASVDLVPLPWCRSQTRSWRCTNHLGWDHPRCKRRWPPVWCSPQARTKMTPRGRRRGHRSRKKNFLFILLKQKMNHTKLEFR